MIDSQAVPDLPDVLLRWLEYLFVAGVCGAITFGLWSWRPSYLSQPDADPFVDIKTIGFLKRQAEISAGFLATLTLLSFPYQAYLASQNTQGLPYTSALLQVLDWHSGLYLWIRMILLAASMQLISRLPPSRAKPHLWWIIIGINAGLLATFSLRSHAAALDSGTALLADWIHLAAMAVWLGGLPPLLFLLQRGGLPAAQLTSRSLRLALLSISLLVLTGVYSAWLQVRTLEALESTPYETALVAKLGLFGLLLLIGAVIFFFLSPRLHTNFEKSVHHLRMTVRFELFSGAVLLATVGIMVSLSPAYEALQADRCQGFIGAFQNASNSLYLVNPIPANPKSLTSGKAVYSSHCLACHGNEGKGDGPAAGLLDPPPANLVKHAAYGAHPDGQLFIWINQAISGSAMPGFDRVLSEEERWNVINYIHTFSQKLILPTLAP